MRIKKQKVAHQVNKIHGANIDHRVLATAGANMFYNAPSDVFPPGNPITAKGSQVMKNMRKSYGAKKGKQVFYASINAKKPGSSKWHR